MHDRLGKHIDIAANDGEGHRHAWRKIVVRCVLITIITAIVVAGGFLLKNDIPEISAWIQAQGKWAPIIFIAIFAIGSCFLIPADIFVFVAGAIFGLWWGYLYVAIAEMIAMLLQFFLARYVFKDRVEGFMQRHPKFNAIDKAVSKQGLKIAFLLRLGPVPLGPLSYILGVSRISMKNYLIASPGVLPSLFAVVYYGVLAAHLTKLASGLEHHSPAHYISMVGGAIVAVITTVYITHVARKALKDADAL
ncbi:TVP38/TMEM64 family protein [Rubellicoccus peritrichatus]|uniref:TVP38/TMEM64 family membrane protein n=1 Tax=Rubellicoccus peritrichatus TaxID=3080537 RepID=A0AAQ3L610_9BACT|nr:TVP38/TMEM64 family protein [Puniceicoccus sp. CR14]WOO39701.1 TVP38/TMEM64 family protein [Puniceicoccus sp. CR14]